MPLAKGAFSQVTDAHEALPLIEADNKDIQYIGRTNTIHAVSGLVNGPHMITVCKDTEAGIGCLEPVFGTGRLSLRWSAAAVSAEAQTGVHR